MNKKFLMFHEIIFSENENTGWNLDTNGKYSISIDVFNSFVEKFKNNFEYTFDDGGLSNLKAAKILEKFGIKGYFFIPTFFIGKPGFLKTSDIKIMSKNHYLFPHSHNHNMKNSNFEYLLSDYKKAKEILEPFTRKCNSFCLPGGSISKNHYKALLVNEFKYVYHSAPINIILNLLYDKKITFIPRYIMTEKNTLESIVKNKLVLNHFDSVKSIVKQIIFYIWKS